MVSIGVIAGTSWVCLIHSHNDGFPHMNFLSPLCAVLIWITCFTVAKYASVIGWRFGVKSLDRGEHLWICVAQSLSAATWQGRAPEIIQQEPQLFVISSGEDCVNGEYVLCGMRNMRTQYQRVGDDKEPVAVMYWHEGGDKSNSEWRLMAYGHKRSKILYRLPECSTPLGSHDIAWKCVEGAAPAPEVMKPAEHVAKEWHEQMELVTSTHDVGTRLATPPTDFVAAPPPAAEPVILMPEPPAEPPAELLAEPPAWLQRLLGAAQLERHCPAAAAWLHSNDIRESDFGDAAEELMAYLDLSTYAKARLREVVPAVTNLPKPTPGVIPNVLAARMRHGALLDREVGFEGLREYVGHFGAASDVLHLGEASRPGTITGQGGSGQPSPESVQCVGQESTLPSQAPTGLQQPQGIVASVGSGGSGRAKARSGQVAIGVRRRPSGGKKAIPRFAAPAGSQGHECALASYFNIMLSQPADQTAAAENSSNQIDQVERTA
jgi:hypothetical protein